jgi:hypothetical protein
VRWFILARGWQKAIGGSTASSQPQLQCPSYYIDWSSPGLHVHTKNAADDQGHLFKMTVAMALCKRLNAHTLTSPLTPQLLSVRMHDQSPSWFVLRSKATADIRSETLVPTVIFTALALLMVGLRWCSRSCCKSATVKPEDYFVTAAMVRT